MELYQGLELLQPPLVPLRLPPSPKAPCSPCPALLTVTWASDCSHRSEDAVEVKELFERCRLSKEEALPMKVIHLSFVTKPTFRGLLSLTPLQSAKEIHQHQFLTY